VNAANLDALIEGNQEMKRRFRRLEKCRVRLPPPAPLILRLHDLEAARRGLRGAVGRALAAEIPALRARAEAKESKNRLKLAELRRLAADCGAAEREAAAARTATAAASRRLEGLSSELQAIHVEMRNGLERANDEGARKGMDGTPETVGCSSRSRGAEKGG
jgi:hypothetical protein